MIIKSDSKIILLLLTCVAICFFANPQKIAAQDETEIQIEAATHALLKNPSTGYAEFNKIGTRVIPYLVKIIFDDANQTSFRQANVSPRLVGVIAQFKTDDAETALITLLTHHGSYIKGRAILYLAGRKSEKSIPNLISLLNDESVYVTENSSGGYEKDILVRDVVVQALEKITGIELLPNKDYKAKAKAWKNKSKGMDEMVAKEDYEMRVKYVVFAVTTGLFLNLSRF